jgi:hypothetical protein
VSELDDFYYWNNLSRGDKRKFFVLMLLKVEAQWERHRRRFYLLLWVAPLIIGEG